MLRCVGDQRAPARRMHKHAGAPGPRMDVYLGRHVHAARASRSEAANARIECARRMAATWRGPTAPTAAMRAREHALARLSVSGFHLLEPGNPTRRHLSVASGRDACTLGSTESIENETTAVAARRGPRVAMPLVSDLNWFS